MVINHVFSVNFIHLDTKCKLNLKSMIHDDFGLKSSTVAEVYDQLQLRLLCVLCVQGGFQLCGFNCSGFNGENRRCQL